MTYKTAVCDDSPADCGHIRELLSQWAQLRGLSIHTETFPSAESFLFRYAEDKTFDLLLLDIEMGAMDGVELAKRVRKDSETVQIIFITGYSDYIAEGYEVAALHYLLKPVNREKLFSVLDRALEKRRQEEGCLTLELPGELLRIPFYEIRYLDVRLNYVTIHGKRDHTVKRTLSEFEALRDERFFRAGRGLIVNLAQINRVTKSDVFLSDGTVLPLPRGAYEPLNRAIIART